MSRRVVGLGLLVGLLILAAVPAQAAPRLRFYKGQTSQQHNVKFWIARNDAGRFLHSMVVVLTLTCDDQTTQEFGIGFGLAETVPITDGEFAFDSVDQTIAFHVAGRLGPLGGDGTLSVAMAALDANEHAQLCTTGDLTGEAEYRRTIRQRRIGLRARTVPITSDSGRIMRLGHVSDQSSGGQVREGRRVRVAA